MELDSLPNHATTLGAFQFLEPAESRFTIHGSPPGSVEPLPQSEDSRHSPQHHLPKFLSFPKRWHFVLRHLSFGSVWNHHFGVRIGMCTNNLDDETKCCLHFFLEKLMNSSRICTWTWKCYICQTKRMFQFSICNQDVPVLDTSMIHPQKAYAFTELSGNITGSLIFKYFIKSCVLFQIENTWWKIFQNH